MSTARFMGADLHVDRMGPVAAGTRVWRAHDGLRVTVVAKAAFAWVDGGTMQPAAPPALQMAERTIDDSPTRSVVAVSDMAPYLPRADALLVGSAWVPHGQRATVRFGIMGREHAKLDKRIFVRAPEGDGLLRIPLIWENAYGGAGDADNPVGTGKVGPRSPLLTHPGDPRRPACFAPISHLWKIRREKVAAPLRNHLEDELLEVPPGFDWSYFQTAPLDQQVSYLEGDEVVELDGLHPARLKLRSQLPSVRAYARVHLDGALSDRLGRLVADTLLLDTDRTLVALTFRSTFPVRSREELDRLELAVALEWRGHPLVWPQRTSSLAATSYIDMRGGPDLAGTGGGAASVEGSDISPWALEAEQARVASPGPGDTMESVSPPPPSSSPVAPASVAPPASVEASASVAPPGRVPPSSRPSAPSSPWIGPRAPEVGTPPSTPPRAGASSDGRARQVRTLVALLATSDEDLPLFAKSMLGPGAQLSAEDLRAAQRSLLAIADAVEVADREAADRLQAAHIALAGI